MASPSLKSYTVVCPDSKFHVHNHKRPEERDTEKPSLLDVCIPSDKVFNFKYAQSMYTHINPHDALLEENYVGSAIDHLRFLWLPNPIPSLPFHKYTSTVRDLRLSCVVPVRWIFDVLPLFEVLENLQFGSRFFYAYEPDFDEQKDLVKIEPKEVPTVKELSCLVYRKVFNSYDDLKKTNITNRVASILRRSMQWLPNLNSVDLNVPSSLKDKVNHFIEHYPSFKGSGTLTFHNDDQFLLYRKRQKRRDSVSDQINGTHPENDAAGIGSDEDEIVITKPKKIKLEAEDSDIVEIEQVRHGALSPPEEQEIVIISDDDEPVSMLTPPQEDRREHRSKVTVDRSNTSSRSNHDSSSTRKHSEKNPKPGRESQFKKRSANSWEPEEAIQTYCSNLIEEFRDSLILAVPTPTTPTIPTTPTTPTIPTTTTISPVPTPPSIREITKLIGTTKFDRNGNKRDEGFYFIAEFADSDEIQIIKNELANTYYPEKVIEFYEASSVFGLEKLDLNKPIA